jgi:secreted PhoX family phosphatase
MDDGFVVPAAHDGMGAFNGPNGTTILVRNHELSFSDLDKGPFGRGASLRSRLDSARLYDAAPTPGGTTTLVYDTQQKKLERHFLSLAGTSTNCGGGPTPWGSWITCEETVQRANATYQQDHGFNFEVPSGAQGPVDPIALKAMGRFKHEAVAVDPQSGIVYQTEDQEDSLFYRFIPAQGGALAAGGRLQALVIREIKSANTSNWNQTTIQPGRSVDVEWIDIQDVESPKDDLRLQGFAKGAARFARGEGMFAGQGMIYFVCTNGGSARAGQIWRYAPSRFEGAPREAEEPGRLQLFIESNDGTILEMADNITIAPWGDLVVCEDGQGGNRVLGVSPKGEIYTLAKNALNSSEFAGGIFSPDGTTLFVNIQSPGMTLAITGPWIGQS